MTEMICIVCPKGCHLHVDENNQYAVTGNRCPRGVAYGQTELTNPTRVIPSTVKIKGAIHNRLPVKTDRPISKQLIAEAVQLLNDVEVTSPISCGDIILPDILGTGVNFIATRDM